MKMDSASFAAKKHFEVPTRTESPRSVLRSSHEDDPVIELAGLDEDLVTKHEIPDRDPQRLRRILEHIDDDVIVGLNPSTLNNTTATRVLYRTCHRRPTGRPPVIGGLRRPGEAAPSRRTALPASTRFLAAPR